jgi:hypothetical protein
VGGERTCGDDGVEGGDEEKEHKAIEDRDDRGGEGVDQDAEGSEAPEEAHHLEDADKAENIYGRQTTVDDP